jgi:hypothetical protein
MIGQSGEAGKLELRVINTHNRTEVYFWHDGQAYKTINLDGDCEEVMIGHWLESTCAWARLEVVGESQQGHKSFNIELRTNLIPSHPNHALLEQITQKANATISSGQNRTVDITDNLKALQSTGWKLHLG